MNQTGEDKTAHLLLESMKARQRVRSSYLVEFHLDLHRRNESAPVLANPSQPLTLLGTSDADLKNG